jgi:hypothetical protein
LEVFGKFLDNLQQGQYYANTTATNFPIPGWYDLGYVRNFKFTPGSKTGNVIAGYRGVIRAKYRAETGEKLTCQFMELSRTTMRIATGTQVLNILKSTSTPSTIGPLSSSGTGHLPQPMGASGYQATGAATGATAGFPTLFVPAGSGAYYNVNDMIVCDQNYVPGTYGFVGDAGANVFQGAVTDTDFIRKTSDYVGVVQQIIPASGNGVSPSQDALILTGPIVGGGNSGTLGVTPNYGPTTGAQIQKIWGYTSREGGTYITEWSAIFVMDTIDASQLLFYYPRLAPDTFTGFTDENLQGATSMQSSALTVNFDALAFDDPLDGETVVAYRAYYPHPGTQPSI